MVFVWFLWSALQVSSTSQGLHLTIEGASVVALPVAVLPGGQPPELQAPPGIQMTWSVPMRFRDLTLRILRIQKTTPGQADLQLLYPSAPTLTTASRLPSAAFQSIYRTIAGSEHVLSSPMVRGGYLIIAPDDFLSTLTPLIQWLQDQGYTVWTVGLSQTGTTTSEIKAFIQNVYDTWTPKVEFVVLAADVDIVGGAGIPAFTYGLDATDLPYALLDGEDYLPDVWIGRIPVDNTLELQVVVQKILGYEKNPDTTDTLWYRRALMVASTHYAITTKLTKMVIRDRLLAHGFFNVDTLFWYPVGPQPGAEDLIAAINQGAGVINYRGWSGALGWHEPPFFVPNIMELQNGWKLPVLYNVTCGSGNFASSVDPAFGEAWLRAGTPSSPKGGVGFFGPTNPSVHTRWNNAIDVGIFEGLLEEGIRQLAPSGVRGLFQLFWEFPDRASPGDSIEFYFHVYNTLGLPSLPVHIGVPHTLTVQHPPSIGPEGGAMHVDVLSNGVPIPDAYVAFTAPDHSPLDHGPVDSDGRFFGEMPPGIQDFVRLTVTAPGYRPYIAEIPVQNMGFPVSVDTAWVEDGNDQALNPNETVTLRVRIRNAGNQNISAGTGILRAIDSLAWVVDSTAAFPGLGPGAQATLSFTVTTAPTLSDSLLLRFEVDLQSGPSERQHFLSFYSVAPVLQVLAIQANPNLGPGTSSTLDLRIANLGSAAADEVTLRLHSAFTGVIVTDSIGSLATLTPGQSTWTGPVFTVQTLPDVIPGRDIWFRLDWITASGAENTIYFNTPLGPSDPHLPSGPGPYGYWAYDDTDTLTGLAPTFDWIELDPAQGGNGTLLALGDDSTTVLTLPFVFKYYGEEVSQVSVCSNGWIAFDSTWYFHFRNWPIPSPHGPQNLVAAYWEDLTVENGGVFYRYDAAQHRWIVEWRAINRADNQTSEVFQVLLYDPAYWPTPTGDGEIVMQYLDVTPVSGSHYAATVGIEDRWHLQGLQYVYGSYYHPNAAPLTAGRAIRWTTAPPDTYSVGIQQPGSPQPTVQLRIPALTSGPPRFYATVDRVASLDFRIFDITGRQVFGQRYRLLPGTQEIRPSGHHIWPTGVYILDLRTSLGTRRRVPIVILQ